jgi:hypothetical protein
MVKALLLPWQLGVMWFYSYWECSLLGIESLDAIARSGSSYNVITEYKYTGAQYILQFLTSAAQIGVSLSLSGKKTAS